MHRTLLTLGLRRDLLDVHLVSKGSNIHQEEERAKMDAKEAKFVIVVDQGSRAAPPVVTDADAQTLLVDHHLSDEFPERATVRNLWPS